MLRAQELVTAAFRKVDRWREEKRPPEHGEEHPLTKDPPP